MIEVIYRRKDGALVRSLASLDTRLCPPFGAWAINGKPLAELEGEILYTGDPGPEADAKWAALTVQP